MVQRRGCPMESDYLILRRASAFDDYDVLCNGVVVGRIMQAAAVPVGMSWMWTLAFGYREDRTPTHGYAATRDAAMAAFAKELAAGIKENSGGEAGAQSKRENVQRVSSSLLKNLKRQRICSSLFFLIQAFG